MILISQPDDPYFRAANAIVALGKKGAKHCDITAVIAGSNGLTNKTSSEGETQEEIVETIAEVSVVKEEEAANIQGKYFQRHCVFL